MPRSPQHPAGGRGYGEQRRLRVLGQLQFVLRPGEAKPGNRKAERPVGLLKHAPGRWERVGEAVPMPADWDPCPGKRKAVLGVK